MTNRFLTDKLVSFFQAIACSFFFEFKTADPSPKKFDSTSNPIKIGPLFPIVILLSIATVSENGVHSPQHMSNQSKALFTSHNFFLALFGFPKKTC